MLHPSEVGMPGWIFRFILSESTSRNFGVNGSAVRAWRKQKAEAAGRNGERWGVEHSRSRNENGRCENGAHLNVHSHLIPFVIHLFSLHTDASLSQEKLEWTADVWLFSLEWNNGLSSLIGHWWVQERECACMASWSHQHFRKNFSRCTHYRHCH